MTTETTKLTENKILKTAKTLFAQKGYDATSIRDICQKADVNVSMVSYYFGGKKELYASVVKEIIQNIIDNMKTILGDSEIPDFTTLDDKVKLMIFFKLINHLIDYFYSDKVSDESIMIIFREQMTSGIPLNSEGYKIFKKLLASILKKDENDKEVILRSITIIGQIHSARIIKQFSLKMMNQDAYTKEDIDLLKGIILGNVRSILSGLGVDCE